jgi:hypothetical protein
MFTDEDELKSAVNWIAEQIGRVCNVLDYDMDYFTLDGDEIETHWSRPACSRGCCGWESGSDSFPLSYLLLPDEELKKTEEGRKLEAERKQREAEEAARKKRELEEARRRLQQAQAKARTAEKDAENELKEAQRQLARLEGSAT